MLCCQGWMGLAQDMAHSRSPTRSESLPSLNALLVRDAGDGVEPSEFGLV